MRSTFMGLEASKRGLFTQQSALYTTGHNISNANTLGYTRQRVNFETTPGFPGSGLNSPTTAGHIGTGVQAHSVQRMRDEFVDRQFRQESNKLGYWSSTTKSISQMEDIMAEPSEYGINQAFTDFWKSIQDVSANPEDASPRKVMLAKAEALADSFNYNYKQLQTIQSNIGNEISVSVSKVNSILKQIAALNAQIQEVEPNGYMPNDLYDARDSLLDELNEYIPVTTERVPSGGNALAIAEGGLTILFNGKELVNGNTYSELQAIGDGNGGANKRIDGNDLTVAFTKLQSTEPMTAKEHEELEKSNTPKTFINDFEHENLEANKGKLLSLVNAYGYKNAAGDTLGIYPEMLQNLDKLAATFKEAFNKVHQEGFSLNGKDISNLDFFEGDGALGLKVNEEFLKDPSLFAASSGAGEEGNGKWAIELSNLQFLGMSGQGAHSILGKPIDLSNLDLDGATFQNFYKGLTGDLAVKGQEAARMEFNSITLQIQIDNNRASHNSVSLDEEMTNMITFQQAYNANARMITVIDETLDKIINGMGRVGL